MGSKDLRNWVKNSSEDTIKTIDKKENEKLPEKMKNSNAKNVITMKSNSNSSKLEQGDLETFLWKAADILRGSIDSSEYKHFIFGLLFLKRLSDQFDEERKQVQGDPEDPDNYQFFVPERDGRIFGKFRRELAMRLIKDLKP